MTLGELNALPEREAFDVLLASCGSKRWAKEMVKRRPFVSVGRVHAAADEVWSSLTEHEWKEAFRSHPKIGGIKHLRKQFQATQHWAAKEQSGVTGASEKTLSLLAQGNALYESKFGYIFIVSATGKSADEMLAILNQRLNNYPDEEIKVAAQEQAKITRIRLEKLFPTLIKHSQS